MKRLAQILLLAGALWALRKTLVHLLTRLTGTWVGAPASGSTDD